MIKINPIIGPIITLTAPRIDAWVQETTLNLERAIPKDIKTRKIVVYVKRKVVFSKNPGTSQSKYKKIIYALVKDDNRVKNMPNPDVKLFRSYASYEFNV